MSAESELAVNSPYLSQDLDLSLQIDVYKILEEAVKLYGESKFSQAIQFLYKVLEIDQNNFLANKLIAKAYYHNQEWKKAIDYASINLNNHPENPESYYNLALFLLSPPVPDLKLFQSAKDLLEQALKLDSTNINLYLSVFKACELMNDLDSAKLWLDKAEEIDSESFSFIFEKANYLKYTGEFDKARSYYRKALAINPGHIESIYNLFFISKFTEMNDEITNVEKLLSLNLSSEHAKTLNFALFKVYDDLKLYDKAFVFLARANSIAKSQVQANVNRDLTIIKTIKEIFSKEYIEKKRKEFNFQLNSDITPIFIVSMPRSGSTLVETILSSHSKVASAGEVLYFKTVMGELEFDLSKKDPLVSSLRCIEDKANDYLRLLKNSVDKESKFIIDKLPVNFSYIGLIKLLYPNAKIIYLDRDPCAVGFSCYKHMFSQGQDYSFDTDDIVNFYSAYYEVQKHWLDIFAKDEILMLNYEDLVDNSSELIKVVLKYCGLEWEDSCEEYYKTKSLVQTASLAQVRKPIYKGSNDAWQNYEKYMPEFFEKLKKLQ